MRERIMNWVLKEFNAEDDFFEGVLRQGANWFIQLKVKDQKIWKSSGTLTTQEFIGKEKENALQSEY